MHWLLLVLVTLNSEHEIFSKSYTKPKALKTVVVGKGFVRNPNGFFDGCPTINRRVKTYIALTDKESKEKERLERLEEQAEKVSRQLAA